MPSVTLLLILANVAVYALQAVQGDVLVWHFALWPIGSVHDADFGSTGFRPWQLVTSAFLHGGLAHLVLNMYALHIFGRDVERLLGARRFLGLYAASVLTASLIQLLVVSASGGPPVPSLGASGGVFGVLLAFGLLFPRRVIMLLIPPIPLPARVFVVLYGLLELVYGVMGTESGVAHFAHLGGMLGAWLLLQRWRSRGLAEAA